MYTGDSATSLDFADQRYYSSTLGRFMTPDPRNGSRKPSIPASWNRYTYVLGDPINHRDPTGLDSLECFEDCSGDPGGDDCWIVGFDENGDPEYDCGDPGQPQPLQQPPPSAPPSCSISLWQRPVPTANGPGWHTYISAVDTTSATPVEDFEGGPVPSWNFINGTLTGVVAPPGQGLKGAPSSSGSNATGPPLPNNFEVGTVYLGADACSDIDKLKQWVSAYNDGPRVTYNFAAIGGYNSNSFTYTLVSQLGLLNYFGTPGGPKPGGGFLILPGWNMLVPGL